MDKVYTVLGAQQWQDSFTYIVCKSREVAESIAASCNQDEQDDYYYWVQEQDFNGEDA